MTDDDLLYALKQRDGSAQAILRNEALPKMRRTCIRILGDSTLGEELANDLFFDFVHESVDNVDHGKALRQYLRLMTVRRTIREQKRRERVAPLQPTGSRSQPDNPPLCVETALIDALDQPTRLERLAWCVRQLDKRAQRILRLRFHREKTVAAIGNVLPDAVLHAEGIIWAASSRHDEISWEDPDLGGLFSHYFIRAFEIEPDNGFGVGLRGMLNYTQMATRQHARSGGVAQTPVINFDELSIEGPIPFSFPTEPNAKLRLEGNLAGYFQVEYIQSGLVERIYKRPNVPLEVAIHAGSVILRAMNGGGDITFVTDLDAGETLVVKPKDLGKDSSLPAFGYQDVAVVPKGPTGNTTLHAIRQTQSENVYLGVNYRHSFLNEAHLNATQMAGVDLTWVTGRWLSSVGVGYGRAREDFAAWSYDLDAVVLNVEGGLGWTGVGWRMDLVVGSEFSIDRVQYGSGHRRTAEGWGPSAGVRAWATAVGTVWTAKATIGARSLVGIGREDDERQWSLGPEIAVGARWGAW